MKLQSYKVTCVANAVVNHVEAVSVDDALNKAAQAEGFEGFEAWKCKALGDKITPNVLAVSVGYWKSEAVRGRFTTKQKAMDACKAKGIDPAMHPVRWYYVETKHLRAL